MRTYLDLRPPQAPRFFPKIIKKKLKKIKKKLKFYPKFYFIFLIFAPPKLFFFNLAPQLGGLAPPLIARDQNQKTKRTLLNLSILHIFAIS
jgi:hypothetical protein